MQRLKQAASHYILGVLIWIDQGLNVLFWPLLNLLIGEGGYRFGNPDETISSVSGKNHQRGTCKACYWLCRCLHWIDKDHCTKSIEHDEAEIFVEQVIDKKVRKVSALVKAVKKTALQLAKVKK